MVPKSENIQRAAVECSQTASLIRPVGDLGEATQKTTKTKPCRMFTIQNSAVGNLCLPQKYLPPRATLRARERD